VTLVHTLDKIASLEEIFNNGQIKHLTRIEQMFENEKEERQKKVNIIKSYYLF